MEHNPLAWMCDNRKTRIMKTVKNKKSRAVTLQVLPTTRETEKKYPAIYPDCPDNYRLYINGIPEQIAYTFRNGIYTAVDSCHFENLFYAISSMPCKSFPDNLRLLISFRNLSKLLTEAFIITRRGDTITILITVGLEIRKKDSITMWNPPEYIIALKKELIKAGYGAKGLRHFDDSSYVDAEFDFNSKGTIAEKAQKSIDKLEAVCESTNNRLVKEALKSRNGLKKDLFKKVAKKILS